MGLSTSQLLEMELWQFNAYSEAYRARMRDSLAVQAQAAWLSAYWNSAAKHKVSLERVLRKLEEPKKQTQRKKIDKEQAASAFRQFEELKKYGWTKT